MDILIVQNDNNPKARDNAFTLLAFLENEGIDCITIDSSGLYKYDYSKGETTVKDVDYDLAVVLGGDGTILRTARFLHGKTTPILGINFGHLGFLANSSDSGVVNLVTDALAGELRAERRSNLSIEVVIDEGLESNNALFKESLEEEEFGVNLAGLNGKREFFALNEIAISRGVMGRVLTYEYDISDTYIAQLSGDGIIVASATGSSGYALAAGGPVVTPEFQGLIVQPLAPHSLIARAVLAGSSDVVHVRLVDERSKCAATLFVDGDMLVFDKAITDLYIKKGDTPTTLLYRESNHFYERVSKTFYI